MGWREAAAPAMTADRLEGMMGIASLVHGIPAD